MRWTKPNLKSLYGLLGITTPVSDAVIEERTEEIRQVMLEKLSQWGVSMQTPIARKIRFASDVQALWYLRAELMVTLSGPMGETQARECVTQMRELFDGLLPAGLQTRPGSLSG